MKSSHDNPKVLSLNQVVKIYPGPPAVTALHGIDLTVLKGEFAALVGPSGSGKSTLLNIASGLENPNEGYVQLAGYKLSELTRAQLFDLRRHHLSFIFQSFNLFPVLTAIENVEYTLLIRGEARKIARKKAMQSLETVGLADRFDHLPNELSGGQQQRVAVARALVTEPSIIFADEPTANLDSQNALQLIELFAELNVSHNLTFLLSTHDQRVFSRATRQIHIQDGRLNGDFSKADTPEKFQQAPQV